MHNTFNHVRKILVSLLFMVAVACEDSTSPEDFMPEYVVESYLFALEDFPEVRLSRTVLFGTAYIFSEQAVRNAAVTITLLDSEGQPEKEYRYFEGSPGIYLPALGIDDAVLPRRAYTLEIKPPDDDTVIRSTTIVPDTFSILESNADTLVYQSTEQLEVTVTPGFYPGRQTIFIFSTEALDPRLDALTPFIADIFNEEEDKLEDLIVNESPTVNEGNFDFNPDGTLTVKLPWIAINFFGPNRITANAIDDNVFDFVRSQQIQAGPSTLSPGEIPNVIDHIEGGTGIFGSFARIVKEVYIKRPGE